MAEKNEIDRYLIVTVPVAELYREPVDQARLLRENEYLLETQVLLNEILLYRGENITRRPQGNNGHDALDRFKGVMQLEKLARIIKETSLCGLGQSAPNPVLSTLRWFREEYEAHVFERVCPAGACTDLRIFHIDVDKCTGCTACTKKCPTGAIIGARKTPHFIVEDKCIGCGSCEETCKFDAIHVN